MVYVKGESQGCTHRSAAIACMVLQSVSAPGESDKLLLG